MSDSMSEPSNSTSPENSTASRVKREPSGVNKIKVKLVGEMALAKDSPGFDPYNSTGGQTAQVPWRRREDRR